MAGAAVADTVSSRVDHGLDGRGVQRFLERTRVQAEHVQRRRRVLYGADRGAQRAAQHPHDRGGLEAVADDVADRDGEAAVRQVDDVVPVAADVQRSHGRQVTHRDVRVELQVGGAEHGFLQGERDPAFTGVGVAELLVQPMQFLRPGVQLRLHRLLGPRRAADRGAAGSDELGHVLHPMDDPHHRPVRREDGRVDRGPPALLEDPGAAGDGDVVLLQHHRVRFAVGEHTVQRRAQVPHPAGVGVVGVVREGVEDVPSDQIVGGTAGRAQIGPVDVGDHQIRAQDQAGARRGGEQRRVVDPRPDRRLRARPASPDELAHAIHSTRCPACSPWVEQVHGRCTGRPAKGQPAITAASSGMRAR